MKIKHVKSDQNSPLTNKVLLALQASQKALFEDDITQSDVFNTLLKNLGASTHASRAYLFETYHETGRPPLIKQTHEWAAEGIEPQIDNPDISHVSLEEIGLKRWQTILSSGQMINEIVANLPPEEQAILAEQNILSLLIMPIFIKNQWRGFIGLDFCEHTYQMTDFERNLLNLYANMVSATLGFNELKASKHQTELLAQDVQQKIHDALEAAEHGVWEWDLTTDKVYYSEILQKQLGYNGHEFTDALTEWSGRVHPDDVDNTIQAVQAHLKGDTDIYRAEFRMRKKDGSYAWMLAIAKATRDANGKPLKLSGTHTDLTQQKELEAALIKQQDISKSLINGFPDLVWLKDEQGVYLAANHRFEDFFGHSTEAIIGNTDYDFVDQALADFFRAHDQKTMAKGGPSINEETITFAKDGHQETIETIKIPIVQNDGKLLGVLGVGRDITDRKKAQAQLSLSASVFSNAHEGILICDKEVKIIDVNPFFQEISGYSKEEALGKNPNIFASGIHDSSFYETMWAQIKTKGFWKGEIWNRNKSGELYAILSNISIIYDEKGEISHYLSVFTDISYLKAHQEQLENMAHFDSLTKLPNRVLLADRLQQAINRSKRNETILAVCFIDLDDFKPVNDTHGHNVGDKLLIELAKRLHAHLREEDTLARIGGDEFVLLLECLEGKDDITHLVNKLLSLIIEPFNIDNKTLTLSASIGITLYPDDHSDADTLLRHSDQSMYEAKLLGKNRLHFFDVTANQAYLELNQSLSEIQNALRNDEFVLYFQPKVSLSQRTIIGFESLIRWNHPKKGLLFPDAFLPVIDGHLLTHELDSWVLQKAFKQLADFCAHDQNYILSINISPASLLTEDFIHELQNQLNNHPQIKPYCLEIEVLETSNFREIEIAQKNLKTIQGLGVRVALDDFGTGASSLSYLKNLPANIIKIDQSFIFDILVDPSDLAIVKGIIQLAEAFDLDVIAEGVETLEHVQKLQEIGCDLIQGYWIAKPLPVDQLPDFIDNWSLPGDFLTDQ